MQAHLKHAHEYSWSDNWNPCICWPRDLCASQQSNNHHVYAPAQGNPNGPRGINQMHRPRTPNWKGGKKKKNHLIKIDYLWKWIWTEFWKCIRTILSVGFGDFPSLNWMIFCVVGKNCEHPVQGDRAEWSWPKFDDPFDVHLFLPVFMCTSFKRFKIIVSNINMVRSLVQSKFSI